MRVCQNRFKHRDTEIQSFLFHLYSRNMLRVSVPLCFISCILTHFHFDQKPAYFKAKVSLS